MYIRIDPFKNSPQGLFRPQRGIAATRAPAWGSRDGLSSSPPLVTPAPPAPSLRPEGTALEPARGVPPPPRRGARPLLAPCSHLRPEPAGGSGASGAGVLRATALPASPLVRNVRRLGSLCAAGK